MRRLLTAIVFAVLVSSPPSGAQEWERGGTYPEAFTTWPFEQSSVVLELEFTPYRRAGVLQGCGWTFTAVTRDWAYRENKPVIVVGSLNYFRFPGKEGGLNLKVLLVDVEDRQGVLWRKQGSADFAWVALNETSFAKQTKPLGTHSDGPERFFSIDDPDLEVLAKFSETIVIDVWFNRKPGGTDLTLRIPVFEEDLKHNLMTPCLMELGKGMLAEYGSGN